MKMIKKEISLNSREYFPKSFISAVGFTSSLLVSSAGAQAQVLNEEAKTLLPQLEVLGDLEATESFILGPVEAGKMKKASTVKVVTREQILQQKMQRLSDVKNVDASISDNYNTPGYFDNLSVRGFLLDPRNNYYREGLPISGETPLPLENKQQIQIYKGLLGFQAGSAAPGGLVQYFVNRPSAESHLNLQVLGNQEGEAGFVADQSASILGSDNHRLRWTLSRIELASPYEKGRGEKSLIALAGLSQLTAQQSFEYEMEWAQKSQRSQPGWSLFGGTLPSPVSPRLNLNNQNWSQPVTFQGLTGSLRWVNELTVQDRIQGTWGFQNLHTDDHLAFPSGCTAESVYDRFCSDGTFDLYDYRSENDRRQSVAARLDITHVRDGEWRQQWMYGVLSANRLERYDYQAYNYAGVGDSAGRNQVPEAPAKTSNNTNRDQGSIEAFVSNRIERAGYWLHPGGRWQSLHRRSVRLDGSRFTDYSQGFFLPSFAIGRSADGGTLALSYSEGVETTVVPNKGTYQNKGQALPAQRSRQWELSGDVLLSSVEKQQGKISWSIFQIERPYVLDNEPTYQMDGVDTRRGLEFDGNYRWGRNLFVVSTMFLEARRENGQLETALNGKKPVNVPEQVVRLQWEKAMKSTSAAQPWFLSVRGLLDSERQILPDNSKQLPAWDRWDLSARGELALVGKEYRWQIDVENIFDKRAWRESPYQYGHVYLYPLAPRLFSFNLSTKF